MLAAPRTVLPNVPRLVRQRSGNIEAHIAVRGFPPYTSLYIFTFKNDCFIFLYMNNILLVESTEKILKIKQMIHFLYKMKDLDQATLFLSIQIEQLSDS